MRVSTFRFCDRLREGILRDTLAASNNLTHSSDEQLRGEKLRTVPHNPSNVRANRAFFGFALLATAHAKTTLTVGSPTSDPKDFLVGARVCSDVDTSEPIAATESGAGVPAQTATVNVTAAAVPTVAKSFESPTVALGNSPNMSFVLSNAGGTALTGVAFSDTLPAGLTAVNGTAAICGGSLSITGGNLLTFTGGTLAGGAVCTITVRVPGVTAGVKNNITGPISSTESGAGAMSNTATVTVIASPAIAKSFGAAGSEASRAVSRRTATRRAQTGGSAPGEPPPSGTPRPPRGQEARAREKLILRWSLREAPGQPG